MSRILTSTRRPVRHCTSRRAQQARRFRQNQARLRNQSVDRAADVAEHKDEVADCKQDMAARNASSVVRKGGPEKKEETKKPSRLGTFGKPEEAKDASESTEVAHATDVAQTGEVTQTRSKDEIALIQAKDDFLAKFEDGTLSPEEQKEIDKRANGTAQSTAEKGILPDIVGHQAAHTYVKTKHDLIKELPDGMTIRTAGNKENLEKLTPELRAKLELHKAAGKYCKLAKKNETEKPLERYDENASDADNLKRMGISPEKIAEMQKENMQTWMDVMKSWHETMAEIRKGWAQINDINRKTAYEIADMQQQSMINRRAKADKHHQTYIHLLTEVWPS